MINLLPSGSIHHLASDWKMSSSEFAAEVNRRAIVLSHHISPQRRTVAIVHADTPSFFADLFAVWAAGGCAACLNPAMAPGELHTAITLCEAACVLTDKADPGDCGVPVLCLADEAVTYRTDKNLPFGPDDAALMLFTSGTTGEPKAVMHSARSLSARVSLNMAYIGSDTLSRTLCVLPTHFGHGLIGNCLTALQSGGDLVLARDNDAFAAAGLGGVIDDTAITFMSSTPSLWRLAMRMSRPPAMQSLKRVHIGSAPLSGKLWGEVSSWVNDAAVVNMYGLTETANWFGGASSRAISPEDGCVGTPWGGAAAIRSADGVITASGTGEIVLRTPSVMLGYFNRPELTATKFEKGWYLTGDVGSIDDRGVIRLSGRADDMINVGGIKVCPEEIDILLERHDAVEEACAFAADDPIAGQVPYAAVRLSEDRPVSTDTLIAWARNRVRPEAAPRKIIVVESIPKTDRGKIRRKDVATAALAQAEQGAT